jgi:hypothetical protein
MSVHHIVLASCLIAFPVGILPPALWGQTPGADTAPAYSPYGQPQPGDTADSAASTSGTRSRPPEADSVSVADSAFATDTATAGDTIRPPDSLRLGTSAPPPGADSARTTADSIRSPGVRDSAKAVPTAAPQRVDRVLSAACGGPDASVTIARDLLVVAFAEDAGATERAAAASSVKGKLIGQPEPGVYYMRIPAGGGEVGLRMAADQLSLLPQVRQVGSRSCPPRSRDTAR